MKTIASVFCVVAFAFILLAPGSAVATDSTDQYLIEELCRQMETAYKSQDTEAVASLYHNLDSRGVNILRKLFDRSDSVSVELKFKEIRPSKTEAVVMMTHISLVHKWCNRKLEASPRQECRLRKFGEDWKFVIK